MLLAMFYKRRAQLEATRRLNDIHRGRAADSVIRLVDKAEDAVDRVVDLIGEG